MLTHISEAIQELTHTKPPLSPEREQEIRQRVEKLKQIGSPHPLVRLVLMDLEELLGELARLRS